MHPAFPRASEAASSGRARRLLRRAIVVGVLLLSLELAPAALAGDDYPAPHRAPTPIDHHVDPWGFYNRECTSFVAWALYSRNGVANFHNSMRGPNGTRGHFGNASNWANNARSIGFTVDTTPAVGAVAHWNGHVAWVSEVRADGTVVVEEYNQRLTGNWGWRAFRPGAPGRPPRYIHIKDIGSGPGSGGGASGVGTRLLGDVNGDRMADAVVMFRDTGLAFVALSQGGAFSAVRSWAHQHTVGADKYFLGDVIRYVTAVPGDGQPRQHRRPDHVRR